ncbi:MAG: hypothetical protein HY698_18015 [Deltaproteobacteria bacterium]|nr:hypothetical protein [Deltaproteobacteria bacterium]
MTGGTLTVLRPWGLMVGLLGAFVVLACSSAKRTSDPPNHKRPALHARHEHEHLHPHGAGDHHHHPHPHPHLEGQDGHHHPY